MLCHRCPSLLRCEQLSSCLTFPHWLPPLCWTKRQTLLCVFLFFARFNGWRRSIVLPPVFPITQWRQLFDSAVFQCHWLFLDDIRHKKCRCQTGWCDKLSCSLSTGSPEPVAYGNDTLFPSASMLTPIFTSHLSCSYVGQTSFLNGLIMTGCLRTRGFSVTPTFTA